MDKNKIDVVDSVVSSEVDEAQKQKFYIEKCKEWLKEKTAELGRPLKACTVTFGCPIV